MFYAAPFQSLLSDVDLSPWHPLSKRRVQHYGYEFVYKVTEENAKQTCQFPGDFSGASLLLPAERRAAEGPPRPTPPFRLPPRREDGGAGGTAGGRGGLHAVGPDDGTEIP